MSLSQQTVLVTGNPVENNVVVTVSNARGLPGTSGSITWDSLTGTASQVPFEPVTPPAYAEGLVFYDTDDKSLVYYGDEPDVAMNIGRELWVRVRNDSGAPILNGKVVYINDAIGQLPTIRLARADSAVTSRVIGIATHDIGNNEFGYVTTVGEVKGLNTVAFQDGDLLFLSADTAGELTTTAPTAPNRVIQVATVLHAHISQGKLYCHPENDSVPSTGIVDSTATGRALITAANAGAARTTMGLGETSTPTFYGLDLIDGATTTLNVYNVPSGANFERLSFRWASNVAFIGTSKGGTGTAGRDLVIETDGTERARFTAAGVFSVDGVQFGRGGGAVATNTAAGPSALGANTTGGHIAAFGRTALAANTTASFNSAFGSGALAAVTTNGSNSAFGYQALLNLSSGANNIAIGTAAGRNIAEGSGLNTSTSNSCFVGTGTRPLASGQTNQNVFGFDAIGLGSNTAVIGNDSIVTTALKGNVVVQRGAQNAVDFERVGMRWVSTDARIGTTKGGTGVARDLVLEADGTERVRVLASNGNVGFGTTSPQQRLDVVGSIRASQPVIFPSFTVATAPTGASLTGGMAYITDEADGPTMAFYDGTNWRRVQDRAIISIAP